MNTISLTLLFAGLCAMLQVALTALVIIRRLQTGVHFWTVAIPSSCGASVRMAIFQKRSPWRCC